MEILESLEGKEEGISALWKFWLSLSWAEFSVLTWQFQKSQSLTHAALLSAVEYLHQPERGWHVVTVPS